MRRMSLLGSVLMSLGLGACGGDVALEPAETGVEVSQELVDNPQPPTCDTSRDWVFRYYSSSAMTTQVGMVSCMCGMVVPQGQTSRYAKLYTYPACIL